MAQPGAHDTEGRFRAKLRTIWPFRPRSAGSTYSSHAPTRFEFSQERPICNGRFILSSPAAVASKGSPAVVPAIRDWTPQALDALFGVVQDATANPQARRKAALKIAEFLSKAGKKAKVIPDEYGSRSCRVACPSRRCIRPFCGRSARSGSRCGGSCSASIALLRRRRRRCSDAERRSKSVD